MKFTKVILAILACTSFLFAQVEGSKAEEKGETKAQEKSEMKAAHKTIYGKLVSVDVMTNSIVVKTKKAQDTLSVDAAATIMSGKKTIPLGELKTESMVTIKYKMMDGKKVAVKIHEKTEPKGKM